ncbi:MAG: hypothetical protein FJX84_01460 [Bacteroidetes bacterium]|nr:hypothetical protein [Bacteroidota bacterium]
MNQIDYFFLDLGFSWLLAKVTPYLFCIFLGIGALYFLRKLDIKKKWLKIVFLFTVCIAPFLLYFSFFPIYEGDFIDSGIKSNSSLDFPSKKSLTVVVLPNCPYCYQSIVLMKKIKERNPSISINYWVSSRDSLSVKSGILKVIPSQFTVVRRSDHENISELVKASYPCFIISNKGKALKQWDNNQIGVSALDEIEKFFKRN